MVGKQVNFFFSPSDEAKFINTINERNDSLISWDDKELYETDPNYLNEKGISQVFIKSDNSHILMTSNFLDADNSEIIDYIRSTSAIFFKYPKTKQKTFEEFVSETNMNTFFSYKEKIVRAGDLRKEDLKNIYEKSFNIVTSTPKNLLKPGRLWASSTYFDGINSIRKEKWFIDWYDSYAKWIKKNCRLSMDKMYYIGEDAYKRYKDGTYIIKGIEWE